ncbi:MAG: hypothetical protein WCK02_01140 [Bacteroidota bacterium]
MKIKYLIIACSFILMIVLYSCGNQEGSETRYIKDEVSCFVLFADKCNSPRSIKIISNTKQLLFDRCFVKNADGNPVEVKNTDLNSRKHHFYDVRDAKNIDNAEIKKIEIIFNNPTEEGRDKISIHVFNMDKTKKTLVELGKGTIIYFPSNFEFKNGITKVLEEEVESRLADIIIKAALK